MLKKSDKIKIKKIGAFILCAEFIILAAVFLDFARYDYEAVYGAQDLESAEDGLKLKTPATALHKGVYEIVAVIYSEAEEEGEVTVCMETSKGIENDVISLYKSDGKLIDYRAYVTKKDAVSSFAATQMKPNLIQVESVNISYLRKASSMTAVLSSAFCFFFIDVFAVWVMVGVQSRQKEEMRKKWQEKGKAVLFLIAASALVSLPLYERGLFFSHDLIFQMNRIYGISLGLSTQFPVRIQPFWLNDYGYAVGVCYGDVLLYLPALFYMAGFPLRFVYKGFLFGINMLTAGIAAHSFGCISGNKKIGRFCAFLYTASIWRMIDVYTRGALGEFCAMAFIPLVILGFWYLFQDTPVLKKGFWYLLLGFTGIIQTHVLTTLMVSLFVVLAVILEMRRFFRPKVIFTIVQAAGAVLLVNAGFLVPLADYYFNVPMQITETVSSMIQGQGSMLKDLAAWKLYPTGWGAYYTVEGRMSLTTGYALLIVFASAVIYGIWKKNTHLIRMIFLTLFAFFMSTRYFPYDQIQKSLPFVSKLINAVQFPWRYLSIAQALCVLLAAMILPGVSAVSVKRRKSRAVLSVCTIVIMIAVIQGIVFQVGYMHLADRRNLLGTCELDSYYFTMEYQLIGTNMDALGNKAVLTSENVDILNMQREGMNFDIVTEITGTGEGVIELPLLAYKGYRAKGERNTEIPVEAGLNNRLKLRLPAEYSGEIIVSFCEPWYWRMAELLSAVAAAGLICMERRKKALRNEEK